MEKKITEKFEVKQLYHRDIGDMFHELANLPYSIFFSTYKYVE